MPMPTRMNRSSETVTHMLRRRVGGLGKMLGALTGIGGIVVIGLQCLWLIQDGYWSPKTPLDLWLWLGNSYSTHAGAATDRIGLWLLGLPLGPVLVVAGLLLFAAGRKIDS
jgi:hypothetical protein